MDECEVHESKGYLNVEFELDKEMENRMRVMITGTGGKQHAPLRFRAIGACSLRIVIGPFDIDTATSKTR
ncbi:hypothetical protein P3T20_004068 [Paraburkholderia sp. GAS206C]|uniref:hypothetical protein n=1 Tax=Paraburkholderia sp. GAS206C TaxID=3035128 RepID=UPI003D1F5913